MLEQLAAAHQLDAGVLESCYESQSTLGDVQADIDYGRQELQAYQSPAFFVVYQDYVHGPIGASRLADAIADGVEATT